MFGKGWTVIDAVSAVVAVVVVCSFVGGSTQVFRRGEVDERWKNEVREGENSHVNGGEGSAETDGAAPREKEAQNVAGGEQ